MKKSHAVCWVGVSKGCENSERALAWRRFKAGEVENALAWRWFKAGEVENALAWR
jgi:hypothetical protein